MSFSSEFLTVRITWLWWFPCETRRTVVTSQNMACSGPISSECPQTFDDTSIFAVSKFFEPPTTTWSFELSHYTDKQTNKMRKKHSIKVWCLCKHVSETTEIEMCQKRFVQSVPFQHSKKRKDGRNKATHIIICSLMFGPNIDGSKCHHRWCHWC